MRAGTFDHSFVKKEFIDVDSSSMKTSEKSKSEIQQLRRGSTQHRMNKTNSLHKKVMKERDIDKLDIDDKNHGINLTDLSDPKYQVLDEFG